MIDTLFLFYLSGYIVSLFLVIFIHVRIEYEDLKVKDLSVFLLVGVLSWIAVIMLIYMVLDKIEIKEKVLIKAKKE